MSILRVEGLHARFDTARGPVHAVRGVDLELRRGEVLGIVGESGSGKSVLLKSLVGLARGSRGVTAGEIAYRFDDSETKPYAGLADARLGTRRWRSTLERRFAGVRGKRVGLVLQNGRAALDPYFTVGRQLANAAGDPDAVGRWLERMGFDDPYSVAKRYPHELSGGMAQRAMLAIVLARRPEILLLDEITTGLDVSLQASVLSLLRELHSESTFSAIIVTHDLGVARTVSDRVMIMRGGEAVQTAETEALFSRSIELQPYTEQLLSSSQLPPATSSTNPTTDVAVTMKGVRKRFTKRGLFGGFGGKHSVAALSDVNLTVRPGECVAIVGESGSGKTTLARILVELIRADAGLIDKGGRDSQILFQNPYTSLNPKMRADAAVAESLQLHADLDRDEADRQARALLASAGLGDKSHQILQSLSGGERRRIGLLRTMASKAPLVVLDEPSSGLDAVYRADVIAMIADAQKADPQRVFCVISHDLGFVSCVADRVFVLFRGRVVESCTVPQLIDRDAPHHPYTQLLLESSRLVAGLGADDRVLAPQLRDALPSGCVFHQRCWRVGEAGELADCVATEPALRQIADEQQIACHEVSHA